MVTERLLPPAEWSRLAGGLLDPAYKTFTPSDKVIVIEEDGRIVGHTWLAQHWHLEGTWIHPMYRGKVTVGRRLLRSIRRLFRALHIGEVYMMAYTAENATLCRKMGQAVHLNCENFAVIVEEKGRPIAWQAQ